MDFKKKLELIKRNTVEIVGEEELKKLLVEKKNPVVYWGTSVTGKPSIAYFFPLLKLSDFSKAGFKVKILLADLHGAMDGTPWAILEHRYDYYKEAISQILLALGTDLKKIEFVKGSEVQLKPEYMYDVLQLASKNSVNDCQRASSEVVKKSSNPDVAGLIYPIMQSLDEHYLGVDVQFGGLDQRKILMFARENLPKINYPARIEIMNPMIPGLVGKKMSSSDPKTKIDLTDDEKTIQKKVNNADCVVGNPENGVMAFLEYVIMVLKQDKGDKFIIERPDKYGGNLEYKDYKDVKKDFVAKKLHPLDLKNAVAKEISNLLKPIQKNKKNLEKFAKKAYKNEI
jgi:tyrosyl-tRNA synthetase